MYGCGRDCLILIPFRLPQISYFTDFSSDSDNCPDVGIGPLLQFPHQQRAGPVLLTLLFPPFILLSLCGSIYSFPLVRYFCLLSAGVLHALLCLKVCSWCILERDVLHVHLLLCHLVSPAVHLSCSMQDLQSSLWQADPLVLACKLLVVVCGI